MQVSPSEGRSQQRGEELRWRSEQEGVGCNNRDKRGMGPRLVLGRNFDADGTVAQFSIKKSRQGETGKTFGGRLEVPSLCEC